MALETIHILSILILFSSFPSLILSASKLKKLPLPSVVGPAAFTFDSKGSGPYTGVADGRVLKYHGSKTGFLEYGVTSPIRNKTLCDGTNNPALGTICGRPAGMGFYYKTGELFIADGYIGLVVIAPGQHVAKLLASGVDGEAFHLLDALEVDQSTGDVYFTDASSLSTPSPDDTTGRIIKYDPKTKQVSVFFDGLAAATGLALSHDGSYILAAELLKNQVQKIWLKGPKANTSEVLVNFSGSPDKIKRNDAGDYWVAVTISSPSIQLLGQRISGCGEILQTVSFSPEFNTTMVTEVNEHRNGLYLGSLDLDYVGLYKGFKNHLVDK